VHLLHTQVKFCCSLTISKSLIFYRVSQENLKIWPCPCKNDIITKDALHTFFPFFLKINTVVPRITKIPIRDLGKTLIIMFQTHRAGDCLLWSTVVHPTWLLILMAGDADEKSCRHHYSFCNSCDCKLVTLTNPWFPVLGLRTCRPALPTQYICPASVLEQLIFTSTLDIQVWFKLILAIYIRC